MNRLTILILIIVTIVRTAYAHNGMEHVMGTVTAISPAAITVKTMDGKVQTVALTDSTRYMNGNATGTMKDVKVGEHVVIHATKKGGALVAAEVRVAQARHEVAEKAVAGDRSALRTSS